MFKLLRLDYEVLKSIMHSGMGGGTYGRFRTVGCIMLPLRGLRHFGLAGTRDACGWYYSYLH